MIRELSSHQYVTAAFDQAIEGQAILLVLQEYSALGEVTRLVMKAPKHVRVPDAIR